MVWIVSGVAESDTTERLSHGATWEAYHSSFDLICSVTKLCPTLCDPMDCSTPGSLVLHCLQEFAQAHVH